MTKLCRKHIRDRLFVLSEKLHSKNSKPFWSYIRSFHQQAAGIAKLKVGSEVFDTPCAIAKALSDQFKSVFTNEPTGDVPTLDSCPDLTKKMASVSMPSFTISSDGVKKALLNINVHKATGPDGIPAKLLKGSASALSDAVSALFQQSLDRGIVPSDWREAIVQPVYKKGGRMLPNNYRPVSLTSILCKTMEHILSSQVNRYLCQSKLIYRNQHGFRKYHSTEGQLISATHSWTMPVDQGSVVDALLLDFSKAFDTVPHRRLISKLSFYNIDAKVIVWVENFLSGRTQKVRVDGALSTPVRVSSGVPQGSVLGPLLFLLYINDIAENVTSKLHLFADDCLLHREIITARDCNELQVDLDRLNAWCSKWLLKFNVSKCHHLRVSSRHSTTPEIYKIDGQTIAGCKSALYLGVTLQSNFKWNEHIDNVVKGSNRLIGLLRRNFRKAPASVKQTLYKTLVRQKLEYAASVWDPYYKKDIDKLEMCQRRAVRFITNTYAPIAPITMLREQRQLPTLASRRKLQRHNILRKYRSGDIVIPGIPGPCDPLRYLVNMRLQATKNSFVHRTWDEANIEKYGVPHPLLVRLQRMTIPNQNLQRPSATVISRRVYSIADLLPT